MTKFLNTRLYHKVSKKGFSPKHVAEVGVWKPHTSNVYLYIKQGIKTTLVEPDPQSIKLIKDEFSHQTNVSLYPVAIANFEGEVELYQKGASTFLSYLPTSPVLSNQNFDIKQAEKFTVKATQFSNIDDGTIDLISIDVEGAEWFVIKNMVSRPVIISIETHGAMYTNPYIKQLQQWLDVNNYLLWFKDRSDSVYVQKDKISITLIDQLNLIKMNIFIKLRRLRKIFIKKLKFKLKPEHINTNNTN